MNWNNYYIKLLYNTHEVAIYLIYFINSLRPGDSLANTHGSDNYVIAHVSNLWGLGSGQMIFIHGSDNLVYAY